MKKYTLKKSSIGKVDALKEPTNKSRSSEDDEY